MARRLEVDELASGRRDLDRAFADGAGDHLALAAQRLEIGVDQAVAVRSDIQKAADRDQQGDDVDREDAPRERGNDAADRLRRFLVFDPVVAPAIPDAAHGQPGGNARPVQTLADRVQRSLMLHSAGIPG